MSTNFKLNTALTTFESLSISITSLTNFQQAPWPLVTLDHFAQSAAEARRLSQSPWLGLTPMVTKRTEWEAYSVENQGWVEKGLAFHDENVSLAEPIPAQIHWHGIPLPASSAGPFLPIWQMSPVPHDVGMVNYDLLSDPIMLHVVDAAGNSKTSVQSPVYEGPMINKTSPQSVLLQPVWATFQSSSSIVTFLASVTAWDVYLGNSLADGINGIVVILANDCGQTFTYELNGFGVEYLGEGDLHDTSYDSMVVEAPLANKAGPTEGACLYSIRIYPTQSLQNTFWTNRPRTYSAVIVLVVAMTTLVFVAYDLLALRHQEQVISSVERTNAIVTSLFPENIQDRLLIEGKMHPAVHQLAGKAGLTTYLKEGRRAKGATFDLTSKPIAELFPHTTVLFCDIVGMLKWCGFHSPSTGS